MARKPAAAFSTAVMAGVANVASAIARFIRVEVRECVLATCGNRPVISIVRIPAIIYVAIKAARTMEPRSGADEQTVYEPVWPVIAIRGAIVRRVIEVPIRANWRRAEIYADADLCRRVSGQPAK
jgi:hypothetical protein